MTGFTLHLMRHGAPELTGRMLGRTDCDVTDAGIAACVANATGLNAKCLIASDLRRARRCADAIGTPVVDARWRELDFGDWDGLAAAEIDADALGRFWQDPDHHAPPGGERWSALVERVGAAIAALVPQPTLVVTHGGAMRAALAHLCGMSHLQAWAFDLPCASVLTFELWAGTPRRGQIRGLRA
ncbi:histidine phosphatase family protein [Sphingomonas sp.]|uniref:histidine phosphatase family protein n=1 Tax=Sphingomonas sp. TaxID=28214 RepID=UPI002C201C8D|nr:histidine phosphatase family protein [Sphingomonas sp.]HTG38758.1 histidine phosphatase family protein [Sphingomonas sp.]